MFVELTQDNLSEVLSQNEKTLVMFGAAWCGNCKLLKPKFKKLSTEYDFPFVYVDADKLPNSRVIELANLPTIASFQGSELVKSDMGNKIDVVNSVLGTIK